MSRRRSPTPCVSRDPVHSPLGFLRASWKHAESARGRRGREYDNLPRSDGHDEGCGKPSAPSAHRAEYVRRGLLTGVRRRGRQRAGCLWTRQRLRAERLAETARGFREASAEALAESIGEAVQTSRRARESREAAAGERGDPERAHSTVLGGRGLRAENERCARAEGLLSSLVDRGGVGSSRD